MYIPVQPIREKLSAAFDEFQKKFSPELLYQVLTDLCMIAESTPRICPEITTLLGEADGSLEYMPLEDIPTGATILVQYRGSLLQYTLTNQSMETIAPYIIRSYYSTTEAPRAWVREAAIFGTFTAGDLAEDFSLVVEHNLGFPFFGVLLFDQQNQRVQPLGYGPLEENPTTHLKVRLGQAFEGTWKLLITY